MEKQNVNCVLQISGNLDRKEKCTKKGVCNFLCVI